jgi:hypothetical protein
MDQAHGLDENALTLDDIAHLGIEEEPITPIIPQKIETVQVGAKPAETDAGSIKKIDGLKLNSPSTAGDDVDTFEPQMHPAIEDRAEAPWDDTRTAAMSFEAAKRIVVGGPLTGNPRVDALLRHGLKIHIDDATSSNLEGLMASKEGAADKEARLPEYTETESIELRN